MMLMPAGVVCPQLFLYKTVNLHLARPAPKRAVAVALLNAVGGTANLWGSYLYLHPPHFYDAFGAREFPFLAVARRAVLISVLGLTIIYAFVITGYKFHVRKLNKRLDEGGGYAQHLVDNKTVTREQIDLGWRFLGYD